MKLTKITCLLILTALSSTAKAQLPTFVRDLGQKHFSNSVPPGNYSGIAHLDTNRYALVSDKNPENGFFIFHIDIDSVSGELLRVSNEGFRGSGLPNQDEEGIAYDSDSKTLWIASEKENRIHEHSLDGKRTGRELKLRENIHTHNNNYGLESVAWSPKYVFATILESPASEILAGKDSLTHYLPYHLNKPTVHSPKGMYFNGVSELLWLEDGSLLVLEREAFIPKKKIGSWVKNYLYRASEKGEELIYQWKTKINLTNYSFANYEGMCFGPKLEDGSQTLIVVADSQDQYKGILKDWFKVIVLKF